MKTKFLLIAIGLYSFTSFAQTDSIRDDNKSDEKSQIKEAIISDVDSSKKVTSTILEVEKKDAEGSPIVSVKPYEIYLDKLDEVLNAELAATLAGLSLAALAFLFSLAYPLKEKISKLKKDRVDADTKKHSEGILEAIVLNEKKLSELNEMTGNIYYSFLFFLLFLLETLTIDIGVEKDSLLNDLPLALPGDLLLSGGPLLIGIGFMWLAAKKMGGILTTRE